MITSLGQGSCRPSVAKSSVRDGFWGGGDYVIMVVGGRGGRGDGGKKEATREVDDIGPVLNR